MTVYCLGNETEIKDRLPLKIIPLLKNELREINFTKYDPTEELPYKEKLVLIDTVLGIKKVTVFTSLSSFSPPPNITVHDYDLYLDLSLRKKLKSFSDFIIIGLPSNLPVKKAAEAVIKLLREADL